jgi:hypothetical protein
MSAGKLTRRLEAIPFRPFEIRLIDDTAIKVPFPMMLVGIDRAVVVTEFGFDEHGRRFANDHRTVSLSDIAAIVDKS